MLARTKQQFVDYFKAEPNLGEFRTEVRISVKNKVEKMASLATLLTENSYEQMLRSYYATTKAGCF